MIVNIIENLMIIVIIVDMGVKGIVKVLKGSGEYMAEKRFSVKKSGRGLYYRDGDYEIDNTIQFIIETVEMKLNQLSDENEELKKENEFLKKKMR